MDEPTYEIYAPGWGFKGLEYHDVTEAINDCEPGDEVVRVHYFVDGSDDVYTETVHTEPGGDY